MIKKGVKKEKMEELRLGIVTNSELSEWFRFNF